MLLIMEGASIRSPGLTFSMPFWRTVEALDTFRLEGSDFPEARNGVFCSSDAGDEAAEGGLSPVS